MRNKVKMNGELIEVEIKSDCWERVVADKLNGNEPRLTYNGETIHADLDVIAAIGYKTEVTLTQEACAGLRETVPMPPPLIPAASRAHLEL